MTTLLFDLDGTLVDSSLDIIDSFQHSFEQMGLVCPAQDQLMTFIGPPLRFTFSQFFNHDTEVDKAVNYFRNYYEHQEIYHDTVYAGITELLIALKSMGYQLFVTTSKQEEAAKNVLGKLGLSHYFTGIYGATASHHHKSDVIRSCLQDYQLQPENCYIIGDTKYDMIGGRETGVHPIGVAWGFGNRQELLDHGAEAMMDKPADLLSYFQSS
ncbi:MULTISPECIES: HAD-IA family hydrolase [unclassified Streptococcus]|uniref:HAD-IA family hydrolase n=1 Tax=unclassified Streptococcus TaxID=2608887 RepID=UPI00359CC134